MKYAIPVSGGKLCGHFGQCSEFMIIDIDQNGKSISKKTIAVAPHNCGGTPLVLAREGVEVVLAGGMGMGPRMAFERNGIEVNMGVAEADPEKAALAHFNRTLVYGANTCEHGDSLCDHHEAHQSLGHN
jgi:predicted Fe-Mo cluster-binding NifX family protein